MQTYFPIFLDLRGRQALVVGAGTIAAGKIESLLEAGAAVRVVSPEAVERVQQLHRDGLIIWQQRTYQDGDIAGAFITVAATNQTQVNERIRAEGEALGKLVNVVDVTPLCNFIFPSVARSGPVQVAVSTSGTSPTLARKLRQAIQARELGPEVGILAELIAERRAGAATKLKTFENKKRFWDLVLESELPTLVRNGHIREAEVILDKWTAKPELLLEANGDPRRVGTANCA